jgi:uncharacterized protein (DUF2267 family)
VRHKQEFLVMIDQAFIHDEPIDAEAMASGVFRLLESRISEGEIEEIRQILPTELKELWPRTGAL